MKMKHPIEVSQEAIVERLAMRAALCHPPIRVERKALGTNAHMFGSLVTDTQKILYGTTMEGLRYVAFSGGQKPVVNIRRSSKGGPLDIVTTTPGREVRTTWLVQHLDHPAWTQVQGFDGFRAVNPVTDIVLLDGERGDSWDVPRLEAYIDAWIPANEEALSKSWEPVVIEFDAARHMAYRLELTCKP